MALEPGFTHPDEHLDGGPDGRVGRSLTPVQPVQQGSTGLDRGAEPLVEAGAEQLDDRHSVLETGPGGRRQEVRCISRGVELRAGSVMAATLSEYQGLR